MPFLPGGVEAGNASERLIESAKMLRGALTGWIASCDAGSIDAVDFIQDFLLNRLKFVRALWPGFMTSTGVQAAIRTKIAGFADDAAVDTALNNCQTAMDTAITWFETNVRDALVVAGGWLAIYNIVNDKLTPRFITNAGQLSAIKTQLQTLKNALSS